MQKSAPASLTDKMPLLSGFLSKKGSWPAIIILFLMLGGIFWQSAMIYKAEASHKKASFEASTNEFISEFNRRVGRYEGLLLSSKALFMASASVSNDEWISYFKTMNLPSIYPAAEVVGYALHNPESNVTTSALAIKKDMNPIEIGPQTFENDQKIKLKKLMRPGFLNIEKLEEAGREIFGLPAQNYLIIGTPLALDNDDHVTGFLYIVLSADTLFGSILNDIEKKNFNLSVSLDGYNEPIYQSVGISRGERADYRQEKSVSVERSGNFWDIRIVAQKETFLWFSLQSVRLFVFGGAASICLCLIIWILIRSTQISMHKLQMTRTQLDETEDLLDVFMKSAPAAMAMMDKDMRYIACSSRWEKDLCKAQGSLQGQSHFDLFPDGLSDNPARKDVINRVHRGETIKSDKALFQTKSGHEDIVRFEFQPWRGSAGDINGMISFIEVITDKVIADEKLAKTNQELEQFAYIASHDLKAPLRGIDNLAKWIQEDMGDQIPAEISDKINLIRGRVNRLETLLEDILLYSRAGRITDSVSMVDSSILVAQIGDDLRNSNLNLVIRPGMPVFETAETPLTQVFTNLIVNAVKHHDCKDINITVTCTDRNRFYEFSVQDDGPGIPVEFQERVFGMFQTLKSRDRKEGSGLGLAISKKLVEWQGGRIWIESREQERGCTFYFLWPKKISNKGEKDDR